MFKKLTAFILIIVIISSLYITASAVSVSVDGNISEFDSVTVDGSILIPLRDMFELLGAEVSWNPESRTGTATVGDFRVVAAVGERFLLVNGERRDMAVETQIVDDKIFVPVRAAAEAFNCIVSYDEETKAVVIDRGELPWSLGDVFRGIINIKNWQYMNIALQIGDTVFIDDIECAEITAFSENGEIGRFAVSYDYSRVFELTVEGPLNLKISR